MSKVPTQKTDFLIKKRAKNGRPAYSVKNFRYKDPQWGRRAVFQKVPPKTFIFLVNMSWDNMGGQKGRATVFSVAKVPTQKTGFLIKKRGGNGCPSLKCEKSLNRNQQFGRRADFQKVPPENLHFFS